jgi:hypothetical protein
MARYLADTFQCASLTHVRQLVIFCVVGTLLREATFLIFCIKCLWDAVGNFLGSRRQSQQTPAKLLYASPCMPARPVAINYFK